MASLLAPGRPPSTCTDPDATGSRPSTTCSSVDLPEPLDPITATMPPAGMAKVPSDQISRPPRTTLTSSKTSASSDTGLVDTKSLGKSGELIHLPSLERRRARCHRFGDIDHRNTGALG